MLTKPIGTGSLVTGIKKNKASDEVAARAIDVMSTLNRDASRTMVDLGARAATDVTGFGLLGHAAQLARTSEVTLHVRARDVPLLPGALELTRRGIVSGAVARNRGLRRGRRWLGR